MYTFWIYYTCQARFCLFFSILICFVLLYDVILCRRARDLPGLPDMSRCQNNVCNKNQKLKSNHNAVLHERDSERERERACRVRGPARPPAVPAAGPRPCPPGPSTAAHPGTAAPPIPRQTHTQQPQSRAQTCLPFPAGTRTTDVGPLATGFTAGANGVYSDSACHDFRF